MPAPRLETKRNVAAITPRDFSFASMCRCAAQRAREQIRYSICMHAHCFLRLPANTKRPATFLYRRQVAENGPWREIQTRN
jgi:hypothetical protein